MTILFAGLAAFIHIYIFYLESIVWGASRTSKLFHTSESDARIMQKLAFNQGFYNLFLAIAILLGLGLRFSGREAQGNTLVDYAALSILGAGLVLFFSDRSLKRPALIQGLPVLAYLGFRVLGY